MLFVLSDSNEDMVGLLPRFTKDVPNITVTVGRDALLPCTVEQLRGFKVSVWILSITLGIHVKTLERTSGEDIGVRISRWLVRFIS